LIAQAKELMEKIEIKLKEEEGTSVIEMDRKFTELFSKSSKKSKKVRKASDFIQMK
jgi:hypothetical protein